jgi:hypothetical protein
MKKNVFVLLVVVGTLFSGPVVAWGGTLGDIGDAATDAYHGAGDAATDAYHGTGDVIHDISAGTVNAFHNAVKAGENFGKVIGRTIEDKARTYFPSRGIEYTAEYTAPQSKVKYEVSLKNDLKKEVLFEVGSSGEYIVPPKKVKKLSSAEKNPVVTISKLDNPKKCLDKAANERCWGIIVTDKQTLPNAFIIYLDEEYYDVVVRAIK